MMKMISRCAALFAMTFAAAGTTACREDAPPLSVARPPPDAGCAIEEAPQNYEVYFVIDVSGSMAPFLRDLAATVQSFSLAFPERDAQGNRILVNYYVIAFVNDVVWVPNNARRMTQPIAVQAAIEDAIDLGRDNTLLTRDLKNAEKDENLLDALAQVLSNAPTNDAKVLVLVATDAGFREAPDTLSGGIMVQSNYQSIKADLEGVGAQIHAFTPDALDGLTRQYAGQPALTTIPGSNSYSLRELESSAELIERTLLDIAQNATCNP